MLVVVTMDSASILFYEHHMPCDTPSAWSAPACCKRIRCAEEAVMGNRQGTVRGAGSSGSRGSARAQAPR